MSTENELLDGVSAEDYLAIGVAFCYQMEEGELNSIQVLEPIPSAYLETLLQGIPTSYQCVKGATVGEVLAERNAATMAGIEGAVFCKNFGDRVAAAARTYQSRSEARDLVAVGETRTDINYSTEKKRVLNSENKVTAEDNVRQHEHTHKIL